MKLSAETLTFLEKCEEHAGMFNVYVCEAAACGRATSVVLRDTGATPFMIGCPREGCTAMAQSRIYRIISYRDRMSGTEWQMIRPTDEEFAAYAAWKRPQTSLAGREHDEAFLSFMRRTREHVEKGGLILVPTGDRRWKSPST